MIEKNLTIGDADVTIEIHDENAKWPMLWILQSPYQKVSRNITEKSLENYSRDLHFKSSDVRDIVKLTNAIGENLELPPTRMLITRHGKSGRFRRRSHLGTYRQRLAKDAERRNIMGTFALTWRHKLLNDPQYQPLLQPDPDNPDILTDQLGIWGHNTINLNTASAELLFHAFEPIGLTLEQAQAIYQHCRQTPLNNTGKINAINGIDTTIANNIRALAAISSDTFSVHVQATIGRTRCRIKAGMHRSQNGQIEAIALTPPE